VVPLHAQSALAVPTGWQEQSASCPPIVLQAQGPRPEAEQAAPHCVASANGQLGSRVSQTASHCTVPCAPMPALQAQLFVHSAVVYLQM
jgi:hypothetical protein